MTSKASDLVTRLNASAVGTTPDRPAVFTPERVEHAGAIAPPDVQRFMVILPKSQHHFMRRFALDMDSDVSTIIRTLLTRIETDPVFAEEVRNLVTEGH